MTAKEYLKQAYLLDKQIQVEVKELEQLREMRGTIQGCSYGEKIGTNPNRNLEAPFIKTIEKIWEYEQKIDAKINRLVDLRAAINAAIESMENPEERLLLKYRYLKNESWEDISYDLNVSNRTVHRIHASALNNFIMGKVESEEAKEALNIADKLSDMILFHSRVRDNGMAMMKPWEA